MYTSKEWCSIHSLKCRELGIANVNSVRNHAIGSRAIISRLEVIEKLEFHSGCVNTLNFNFNGTLIASGADDLKIAIWDWVNFPQKPVISYASGHQGNVFQAKFMPNTNDNVIVSCARDGEVRVGSISNAGESQETRMIVEHKDSAHKLSIVSGSPVLLKSCGEDGAVYDIDLRQPKQSKLFSLRNEGEIKVPLYSIHINPSNEFEFAVAGRDQWARIFDSRKVSDSSQYSAVKRFCPDALKEKKGLRQTITCLMYNYNGNELVCSYSGDEIYLFDTSHSSESNSTHVYKGHKNTDTVKGVNFIGPYHNYVISGSDCGHIFIWDKNTEDIVTFVEGDSMTVNVVEPHPNSCILATSGLDHDFKLMQPTGEPFERNKEFEEQLKINVESRDEDRQLSNGNRIIYLMFQQLARQRRRMDQQANGEVDVDVDESSDADSSNDGNDDVDPTGCIQS